MVILCAWGPGKDTGRRPLASTHLSPGPENSPDVPCNMRLVGRWPGSFHRLTQS